jgi:hypothetical protein
MKKIVILTLSVCALLWISGASAGKYPGKNSPESVVTCGPAGEYLVVTKSISKAIDEEQCRTHHTGGPDPCSPCISSLENQGCEMIDVVVETNDSETLLTYLLSCVKP